MVRLLTYNVHRCLGVDRRLDVGRVAAVIAAEEPDIVALQEVDVRRARSGGVDQAFEIARRLGMAAHFNAAIRVEEEAYGDAIFTALPERLIRAGPLPGHPRFHRLEPRGALWVAVETGGAGLQVINTHLGLVPREQLLQARALAGPEWVGAALANGPTVLLGDFNTRAASAPGRCLLRRLHDARRVAEHPPSTGTFPSRWPVSQLDHVFLGGGAAAISVRVPNGPLARVASDHLPLVVDIGIESATAR